MQYCINPDCRNPENSDSVEVCQVCATSLLLQGRYQITQLICERPYTRLFNVVDRTDPSLPLILKTLISEEAKIQQLFQQEQQLLIQLTHVGIPRGHDAFTLTLANGKTIPCLIMEQIPGENLEQWMQHHPPIAQDLAIDWLKQLLDTLDYIHQRHVFHRDIKPANIMHQPDGQLVLIDFGATRQVTETNIDRDTTKVVSFGYTAPEQAYGKAFSQSDFYALGKTFMHLLAGQFIAWDFVPSRPIAPALLELLEDMTADRVGDRPATAKVILQRLAEIERAAILQRLAEIEQTPIALQRQAEIDRAKIRNRWRQIGLGFAAGVACGGLATIPLLREINWEMTIDRFFPKAACDLTIGDRIGCGEESFLSSIGLETSLGVAAERYRATKQKAIQAFRDRQWQLARQKFQIVWDKTKDPEALVYLNNLKVLTEPKLQARKITIAAVTPFDGGIGLMTRGMNMLRGVAQAQDRAIKAGIGLQVVLVDDGNDADIARELAKELVRRQDIVAVVGHQVSDATLTAMKVYDSAQMVAISPTSTSDELATYTLKKQNFLFRTASKNSVNATNMAAFVMNVTTVRTVAVFYNPDKSYSRSLAGAFKETFQALQGKVVRDEGGLFYLSCAESEPSCYRRRFEVAKAINYAKSQGAGAFVVIPDASESKSNALNEAIELIDSAGSIWTIGGDALAGETRLRPKAIGRTFVSSSWDPSQDPNSPLIRFWDHSLHKPTISWYTYTSYNATQVIVRAAMQTNGKLDRLQLREAIAHPKFVADGASGAVRFRDGTGELLTPNVALSQVVKCGNNITFQPLVGAISPVTNRPNCPPP